MCACTNACVITVHVSQLQCVGIVTVNREVLVGIHAVNRFLEMFCRPVVPGVTTTRLTEVACMLEHKHRDTKVGECCQTELADDQKDASTCIPTLGPFSSLYTTAHA